MEQQQVADQKSSRYYIYIKPVIGNKYVRSFAPYIFSLISIIIFIIFAIRPTVITIIGLQKTIQDSQQVLDILNKKSEDLVLGRKNLDALGQPILDKINTRIPKEPAVTNLINSLNQASSNSASVSAMQVQPVTIYDVAASTAPNSINEVSFSFNVQGAYSELLSVIDHLLKSPRMLNLTNTILSRSTEGATQLSISGTTYYLK